MDQWFLVFENNNDIFFSFFICTEKERERGSEEGKERERKKIA